MSKETPEPGDVCRWQDETCIVTGHDPLDPLDPPGVMVSFVSDGAVAPRNLSDLEVLFNLSALLSGDPAAWAAALRFLPSPFLLEVGEGEEKREVMGLPKGLQFRDTQIADEDDRVQATAFCLRDDTWSVFVGEHGTKRQSEGHGDFPTAVTAALKGEPDA